jgi:hypothetical protein
MIKIDSINIQFNEVSTELGFYNTLTNVDTVNKIITISGGSKVDYIPKSTITEISLQTEKQVVETKKA